MRVLAEQQVVPSSVLILRSIDPVGCGLNPFFKTVNSSARNNYPEMML
jgi:hypothetical protein